MNNTKNWNEIWEELRTNISKQPHCQHHPEYPYVHTLSQGVVNDVLEIRSDGILVRSHQTSREDFIEASRFEIWWKQLAITGWASLVPGGEGNPHPWRSYIIGAIFVTCLPGIIKKTTSNRIEYSS